MDRNELPRIIEAHRRWVNGNDGEERADLQGADLQRAGLDYSCLPLWCGGSRFKADMRLVRQILAHVCTIEIADADDCMKAAIAAVLPEAKKSHRAEGLGLLDD